MADKSATLQPVWKRWRGLGIPDERITALNEAESTYTQRGPAPGVPEAQSDTEAALKALGVAPLDPATSAPYTVDVLATKAGMPGNDDTAAHAVWRYQGDADYRGHDLPHVPTHWEAIEWVSGLTDTPGYPHAVTLDNGKIVCCYRRNHTTTTTYRVEVVVFDPDALTWGSAVTVVNHGSAYGAGRDMHPSMVVLSSGRIQLYYWYELDDGNMQIRMYYSDDDGSTWAIGSRYCLPAAEEYAAATAGGTKYDEFRRIRAVELNGDVLLMTSQRVSNTAVGAGNLPDVYVQFASADVGATFTEITRGAATTTTDNLNGMHHELLAVNGQIVIVLPYGNPSTVARIKMIRMGSVWKNFKTAPSDTQAGDPRVMAFAALGVSGHYVSDVDISACADESGAIYVFMRDCNGTEECVVRRFTSYDVSQSLGVSAYDADFGPFWASGDANTHIKRHCVTWHRGRAVMVHQWDADPGNEDLSLGMLCLGGHSTAPMPLYGSTFDSASYVGPEVTWLPFDEPGDVAGWTAAGAGTDTLASGRLEISTSGNARNYSQNPAGTVAEGVIVYGEVAPQTSTTVTDAVICQVRLADGVNDYDVTIRFGTAQILLRDNNAVSTIGTITIDTTNGVAFELGITSSGVELKVRLWNASPDREWTDSITGASLTNDTVTPAANHLVTWGHASSTAESRWFMFWLQSDEWTGENLYSRTYPLDLHPRALSAMATDLGAGWRVAMTDGPALYGDQWLAAPSFAYPLSNAQPWTRHTSPRITWRTVAETAQTLTWDLDDSLAEQHGNHNVAIVLGVFGANWRTATLYGRDAGGAYSTTLATIDAAEGMNALRWTRQGNTITPQAPSGGSSEPYLFYQECRGWSIELEPGEVRRVQSNSEGGWRTAGKQARIVIEDADGSEGASGTAGKLWPRNFAVIVPTVGTFRSLRLVIDAQTTADGFIETGHVGIYQLLVHGQVPSWGRTQDLQRALEETYTRDRRRRARRLAPAARRITYAWTDQVDQTVPLANGTPDYIGLDTSGTAPGVASLTDTAYQLEGLAEGIDGGRRPILWLPRIECPATLANETLNRRADLAFVVLDGDVSFDEVVDGAERIAAVPLLELT